ncbi:MAG: hypothetical protein J6K77_04415, partial [Ruminococcus sp.]|nr:hypothetical protein [Ruminococcus sp.]
KISLYIFIYGQKVYKGTPEGCIDLRSIWGAAPNPARGAASGLCQRDIVPLETQFYRLRRLGALPQTLPEAPPLDSAKGALSLWKPGFVGFASLQNQAAAIQLQQPDSISKIMN